MAAITLRLRGELLESRRLMAADLADPLSIAVQSSGMDGLRAAEIQLSYDPRLLNIQASDIRPGAAWKDQASLVSNVDAETGSVRIFLFSVEPIDTQRGQLVDLHFAVNEGNNVDSGSVALSHMRLNEGELESRGELTELAMDAEDAHAAVSTQTVVDTTHEAENEARSQVTSDLDGPRDYACSPWELSTSALDENDSNAGKQPGLSHTQTAAFEFPQSVSPTDLWQLAAPLVKLKNANLFE